MSIQNFFTRRGSPLACALCLLLSACTAPAKRDDDVATRAQARWDLLLSGDYAGAYGYLSPGYRSSVTTIQYQRNLLLQKVRWKDARYIESECLEKSCKVMINLNYMLSRPLPGVPQYEGTQTIEEDWVLADGQWWYVPKN